MTQLHPNLIKLNMKYYLLLSISSSLIKWRNKIQNDWLINKRKKGWKSQMIVFSPLKSSARHHFTSHLKNVFSKYQKKFSGTRNKKILIKIRIELSLQNTIYKVWTKTKQWNSCGWKSDFFFLQPLRCFKPETFVNYKKQSRKKYSIM